MASGAILKLKNQENKIRGELSPTKYLFIILTYKGRLKDDLLKTKIFS